MARRVVYTCRSSVVQLYCSPDVVYHPSDFHPPPTSTPGAAMSRVTALTHSLVGKKILMAVSGVV
ncbi:MAG TPA: hypothetical protein VH833_00965, partial [Gemmatimonadales bacterium]